MTDALTPAEIRRHTLRRNALRLVAVAVLLVTLAVLTVLSVRDYFTVSEVRLPSVVGMSFEQAARVLRQSRLEPVAFVENVPGAEADAVTSQAPEAGAVVRRGRTVSLGVNSPSAAAKAPRLVGLDRGDAIRRAAELQLPVPRLDYRPDASPAGTVLEQDPAPGADLRQGVELALVVSSGPQRVSAALPDLTGTDVDAAVKRLHDLGFRQVETVASSVSFDRARAVTSMRPAGGQEYPLSTPVSLFYALSGRNVVQVPDVAGMPLWRAQLALQASQLRVGNVTWVQRADVPQGVVEAAPSSYTVPGTPIELTVNGTPGDTPLPTFPNAGNGGLPNAPGSGAAPGQQEQRPSAGGATRTVPFVFNPANMGVKRLMEKPYQLKLVVTDADGERTVLDRTLQPGQGVTTSVTVNGDSPLLQTYIDGVFFQAWRP